VISVPIMVVMMRMASNGDIMGKFVVKRRLRILGWAATVVMALCQSRPRFGRDGL
jgi:Mn2+/Fe2+ NRAMP family transporter